ncbi:MAG: hypothetical protein EXS59_02980 [Candidatus Taylorbacteria bacterium]|nr:hypothetical protein [Candidatus Taylorbacteria bacterium]
MKSKISVTINSEQKQLTYVYVGLIHERRTQEEFALPIASFYMEWGKAIPQCPHYEIEVLEPEEGILRKRELHVHNSEKSASVYVCYPKAIPTLQDALSKFVVWCLGCVSRTDFGIDSDLNYVHVGYENDDAGFFKMMKGRFGISITQEIVTTISD